MQNNFIQFKKQRDFGSIISDTFQFIRLEYKAIFRLYLKHVGWMLLLLVAAGTYYQYASLTTINTINITDGVNEYLIETLMSSGLALLILLLASIAYSALSVTTINGIIKSYAHNKGEISDQDVKETISRFFGRILLSTVTVGIIVFIGFLLCFLPGIYLFVPLSLIFSVIIFQEKSFSEAFSECFKLIKQNWWITFATILVISILIALVSGVFQIPATVLTVMETVTSVQENGGESMPNLAKNWVYILFYVIALIAQYILSLVSLITLVFIYFNLNEIHNKTGTLEDIDSIGQ